ncbi:MAG: hypothetical protein L3K15_04950 [Thermoplasmata archaeon]|nr:hypothetical protein [Thermoplasmata archaeon]
MVGRWQLPMAELRASSLRLPRSHRWLLTLGLTFAIAAIALTAFALGPTVPGAGRVALQFGGSTHQRTTAATGTTLPPARLALGIGSTPSAICGFTATTCPSGTGVGRVTLTASADTTGLVSYPAVQVVFVLEYSPLDGVYNPTQDKIPYITCPSGGVPAGLPCEESNGVPFFIANAGEVASAIQANNPHASVTFGLVDYYATNDQWDFDGGSEYHVDVSNFVPANQFGAAVRSTFQSDVLNGGWTYYFSGFQDNFLHSSMITALYGTLAGQGLNWVNNTHHVVIWMGSTAPRDPNYGENYCVSPSFQVTVWGNYAGCTAPTCEPSYIFPTTTSPACEGWVKSQDGTAAHTIAAFAHSAPACTSAIGGSCPIDMIDLVDSATDFMSKDWQTGKTFPGGGVGGTQVQLDVEHVLAAGCDMAAATGGSWNGPTWFTCPDGTQGTLNYVPHGPADKPNVNNPSLLAAFRTASFGPVVATQVAKATNKPMFTFVGHGNIVPAPGSLLQAAAGCARGALTLPTCQTAPTITVANGRTTLAWNWSTDPKANVMYVGDSWTASFNIVANGPPFTTVPVDACILTTCRQAGSDAVAGGLFTNALYIPVDNGTPVQPSFPVATILVEPTSTPTPAPAPPPTPPTLAPAIPVPAQVGTPILQLVGLANQVGVGSVSLQATAAGLLAAGFMRLATKNRPIAMAIASKSGKFTSAFESSAQPENPTWLGKME